MSCDKFTHRFKKIKKFTHLTDRQLEAIIKKQRKNYALGEKTVTKSTYYTIRSQGFDNITRSIMTLAVMIHCDIIHPNDVHMIITKIANLLDEEVDLEKIYTLVRKAITDIS